MARLPRDIQALVDRLEPEIRNAFLEAIDQITSAAQMNRLIAALEAGNVEEAIEALRIEQGFFSPLNEATRGAYLDGGNLVLSGLKLKDPFSGDKFVLGFDGRAVRAERWLRDQSSRLIVEIIDQQREMAREILRDKLQAGTNPRTTALDIVGRMNNATGKREGGFIGLTTQQARWALNAEDQLRNAHLPGEIDPITGQRKPSPGSLYLGRQRRDARFDARVREAMTSGKQIAEADIQRMVTRYRDRLKKYRGDLIAENEALTSLRAGQMEGFRQLVDSGRVRDDQIEREWSDTGDGRVRHDHRAMRGQKVHGLDQPFTFPDGTQALFPGDVSLGSPAKNTIRCRCLQHVRIKSNLMR
ncbi:phage minor head protein [Paracoccus sp. (in: a-proteobacteria)]|uniref:phage minor head protein n=1 Tax=Paracoccus sp. TaxID=267 RepID=UPI0028A16053|nr:phage minor head protein [Paracoccus sp. (in: a-proteobacteria)]